VNKKKGGEEETKTRGKNKKTKGGQGGRNRSEIFEIL
jgi:hypothetical protein